MTDNVLIWLFMAGGAVVALYLLGVLAGTNAAVVRSERILKRMDEKLGRRGMPDTKRPIPPPPSPDKLPPYTQAAIARTQPNWYDPRPTITEILRDENGEKYEN